jgi:hypothetical protein
MTMTTAILAVCALACPLMMLGMMWTKRGRGSDQQSDNTRTSDGGRDWRAVSSA